MARDKEPLTRKSTDYGTQTSGQTKRLSDGVGKLTKRNALEDPQNHPSQHLEEDSEADSRRFGS